MNFLRYRVARTCSLKKSLSMHNKTEPNRYSSLRSKRNPTPYFNWFQGEQTRLFEAQKVKIDRQ